MTILELRILVRNLLQEPDPLQREYSNAALNTYYKAGLELFFRKVQPFRSAKFVGFNPNIGNPPDFLPNFTPGGYLWPDDCWTLRTAAYRDPAITNDRMTMIRFISEREFDIALTNPVGVGTLGILYGFNYDRIMYVKGQLSPMPDVRFIYVRGPRQLEMTTAGEFSAATLNSQIDIPPQYAEAIGYYMLSKARLSKGDSEDHDRYLSMFDQMTMEAKGEFREDGVEAFNPTIQVADDWGSYPSDPLAGVRH